ncbi:MAG: glutamine-hydrolyzing carbamoyl-phosphate synthase small subunit [Deltaproteobacteria bacterium]|nr:glutamine-hydrolyzing carbamoyl-phosphate synthase small subunit [Deltaproteobacteria bacterium]
MTLKRTKKAFLALADGTVFEGLSFGAEGSAEGEVCFNTSMTGYQEILTDPSYRGQIVAMTAPHIGNYGINQEDVESRRPWVEGFIVKEPSPYPSNWRSEITLDEYLKRNNIVGIYGIDTRALTRHLRSAGAMQGVLSSVDLNKDSLVQKAENSVSLAGRDLVKDVTCDKPYKWAQGLWAMDNGHAGAARYKGYPTLRVIAYDFGIKMNILRNLVSAGLDVTVVPAATTAKEVMDMNPHGVFLSNGPGDPSAVTYAIENVSGLIGKRPIFGICLGHQILALALKGKTYKLKFGHRGANQPVKDLKTGTVEITAQNHGFAVDIASLGNDVELTHINLNDKTVEGMAHKRYPIFSVQYHPEASPGPHDSMYLFKRFREVMGG